jgi:hypothetical protein
MASPQDVLTCAMKNHPDVLKFDVELRNLGAFDALARQRPNPQLESEVANQNGDDNPSFKGQAVYLHTVELGGKRKKTNSAGRRKEESHRGASGARQRRDRAKNGS